MRHFKEYDRIIAISERSAGNESVGHEWVETRSFDKNTTLYEVIEWGRMTNGKLHLTIDESSVKGIEMHF